MSKILCHDNDGFKYFDTYNEQWEFLSNDTPTKDDFTTYGVESFNTDMGLSDMYDVYVLNDEEETSDYLACEVCPIEQHIIGHSATDMLLTKTLCDVEFFNHEFTYRILPDRDETGNKYLNIHLYVDKLTPDDVYFRVYSVQFFGRPYVSRSQYWDPSKQHKIIRYDPEDPRWRDRYGNVITAQYLLAVGNSTSISYDYTPYIGMDLPTNVPQWAFVTSIAREYERTIYTMNVIFDKATSRDIWIYIRAYSPYTGNCETECLYRRPYDGTLVFTDFIVTNNRFYLASFDKNDNRGRFLIIDRRTKEESWTSYVPYEYGDNIPNRFHSARGRMEWYDSKTIITMTWNRILLYDTNNDTWSSISIQPAGATRVHEFYDFAISDTTICATDEPCLSDAFYNVYLFDKQTGECTRLQVSGLNDSGNTYDRYGLVQYCDGKFYVCYRQALAIIDEKTKTIEKTIRGMPWGPPVYMCAYNGNVLISPAGNKMYMYSTSYDRFNIVYGNWDIPGSYPSLRYSEQYNGYTVYNTHYVGDITYTIMRTALVGGYCYIPRYTMCFVNMTSNSTYEMGETYNRYMIPFNSSNVDNLEFDERFVEATGSCLRIHNGILEYPLVSSDLGSDIKHSEINKSDYKQLINVSTKSNDDES